MGKQPLNLIERTMQPSLKVDRERGIIFGAKLLGEKSANGRIYGQAVREKHKGIYDGAAIFLEHADENGHLVTDNVGWSENIEVKPDGTFGDVHLLLTHKETPTLLERAERRPGLCGISHEVKGDGRIDKDGTLIVESMQGPAILAIVSNPATTQGFFESRKTTVAITIQKLFERALGTSTETKLKGRIVALMEDDAAPVDMTLPVDAAPAEDASAEDQLKAGFRAAINKVLDDDSLDMKAKLAKVKEILTAEEKLLAEPAAAETPAETPAETDTTNESKTRAERDELNLLREEKAARKLCESLAFVPSELELDAIVGLKPDRRKAYIESQKAKSAVRTPRSGTPLKEEKQPDPADDLSRLRSPAV